MKLFSLSLNRNWYQAIIFYFAYSILFLIASIIFFLFFLPFVYSFVYSFDASFAGMESFMVILYFSLAYFILSNKDLNFRTFLIYLFVFLFISLSLDIFALMYLTTIKNQNDLNILHISFKTMFYALISALSILILGALFNSFETSIFLFFFNQFYNDIDYVVNSDKAYLNFLQY